MSPLETKLLAALKDAEVALSHFENTTRLRVNPPTLDNIRVAIAEAEERRAQPPSDGWIPWEGGECPVDPDICVEVKLRSGKAWLDNGAEAAGSWDWTHDPNHGIEDIIAYRLANKDNA